MGITHAEVGSWLLSRWGLDAFTIDAARYHHEPLERIHGAFPLIKIVYAANLLADMTDSDLSRSKVVRELFGLGFTDITDMLSAAREEVRELAESLGIQIAPVELPQQPREGKDGEQVDVLAGEVRDVALLQTALQGLMDAVDRDAIHKAAREGFEILFGTPAVLLFVPRRGPRTARPAGHGGLQAPPRPGIEPSPWDGTNRSPCRP